jgi:hypothetical protein
MSKVDTLRAAIDYIQDLQEILNDDGVMPSFPDYSSSSTETPSSPATSTCSSDTVPSSPTYQPVSSDYREPAVTCHTDQSDFNQTTQQFSHYLPQLQSFHQPMNSQPPVNNYYHPQYQQNCNDYSGQVPSSYSNCFNIDFSRPHSTDTCPSPTSSYYTNSDHEQISPQEEAELLEFASWFH